MSLVIIASNPSFVRLTPQHNQFIDVAEFFCDTIQGENFVGWPTAFLRVQHCTNHCIWCDSQAVWKFGNPYTFDELFELMEKADLIRKFKEGQHLALTGGSPVLQQKKLVPFIDMFINRYKFKPFIEIENECTRMPSDELISFVDLWNNSPKLSMSGNPYQIRYRPDVLQKLSSLNNSWFKFVVSQESDWEEILRDYLVKQLIKRDQIVLMPLGGSREELELNREFTLNLAIRENVRYTTREHVVVWNKMTGV